MKYALMLLILIANDCRNQKHKEMNIPIINNSSEIFDITVFQSKRESEQITRFINNKKTEIFINMKNNLYEEKDASGKRLVYYSKGHDQNSNISGYDYSENSRIGIYKEFYPNGSIKTKGLYCWFGFKIGEWYFYNFEGSLIETKNYDNGFTFSFDKVFAFCYENKISLEKKSSGYRTQIFKVESNDVNFWEIIYPDFDKSVNRKIKLDGMTGEILETSQIPLPIWEEDSN